MIDRLLKIFLVVSLSFVAFIVWVNLYYVEPSQNEQPSQQAEAEHNLQTALAELAREPNEYEVAAAAQVGLRHYLRTPSKASFAIPAIQKQPDGHTWAVAGYVDSQNVFGAMVRDTYIVGIRPVCDNYFDRNCWFITKLMIGDSVFINRSVKEIRTALGQYALYYAGHDPGPIDGQMGPRTRDALRDYQKKWGLPVTGNFDATTEQRLRIH